MQVNKVSDSTNFKAKLIIGDERIQNFIKSSFLSDSSSTFDTLDKLSSIYPDSVLMMNIKNINNKDYLVVKNGLTGVMEKKFIHNAENVQSKDNLAFLNLIKNTMAKKSFWINN